MLEKFNSFKKIKRKEKIMLDIKIERTQTPKQKPAKGEKLGFGHIFTDHMFVMN